MPVRLLAGVLCIIAGLTGAAQAQFVELRLERAQQEMDRVKQLVAQGTLPRSQLAQVQTQLDDVQDEVILAETLYSSTPVADFTTEQAQQMLEALARHALHSRMDDVYAAETATLPPKAA